VDTPDVDSIETDNRKTAEDLYLLCDAAVFVTSQEKYADEVPFEFLRRIIMDHKPYLFLLNKAPDSMRSEEVAVPFRETDFKLDSSRIWRIPHTSGRPSEAIPNIAAFRDFYDRFEETFAPGRVESLQQNEKQKRIRSLDADLARLQNLIEDEKYATDEWSKRLAALFQEISQELLKEEEARFSAGSREYLKKEIRTLFSKYDILAKPRRLIKDALLTPLRLLGLRSPSRPSRQRETLLEVGRKTDISPLRRAVAKANRSVLEKMSPSDHSAPLYSQLRRPGLVLSDEEIQQFFLQEQEQLATWLEEAFRKLSKGLTKRKRWGIYSTSVLWGILILSFEIIVGGGFTVLDALLDSALAPFVTKGAVELFAFREIRKVARELSERYQTGLLNVLNHQRDRYMSSLASLTTDAEALASLRALHREISTWNSSLED
jgi:hypothetical protein